MFNWVGLIGFFFFKLTIVLTGWLGFVKLLWVKKRYKCLVWVIRIV